MSNLRSQYESDYAHYAAYRELIISGQQNSSDNIDKLVLTLSSASIGLVISFLGKAIFDAKDINLVTFWLLEYGLFALIGSLFFVIASMLLSSFIYQKNGKLCDRIMSNRTELVTLLDKNPTDNPEVSTDKPEVIEFYESSTLRSATQLAHYLSPSLLIIGVIFIGLFFINNMEILEHGENTSTTSNAASTTSRASKGEYSSSATTTATQSSAKSILEEIKMNTHDEKSLPPPPPPPKAPEKKE